MRDDWMQKKFENLKYLSWLAVVGVVVFCVALLPRSVLAKIIFGLSALALLAPLIIYLVLMTVWHWKYRYRGEHSDLWGAILLIETSGWFKIVYWFRHILPDWRGKGRYASTASAGEARH